MAAAPVMLRWRFGALVLWAVGVQVHEVLATAGLALLTVASLPELRERAARASLWREGWPVFAFVAWALLAPLLGGALPRGEGVARWVDWLTIPLVAAAAARLSARQWGVLAGAAFGTLVLSSVVAGLQHVGAWPAEATFAPLSWTGISFFRVYEQVPGEARYMAGGLLFHRLKFGHVSGLVVVAALAAARHLGGRWRVAALAAASVGFVAVWLFPYARMAAVAMTVGAGVAVVLASGSPRRALMGVALMGLVGLGAIAAIAPLRARFASALTDQGSGQRTQHLQAGLEAVRQHPLVGVGAGQFTPAKFGDEAMAEHVRANPGKAHNQFVSIAAEAGVPGGLGFLALLAWLAARAWRRALGPLAVGALALFATLSLAHDPLFQAPVSMALVLALGLGSTARGPLVGGEPGAAG